MNTTVVNCKKSEYDVYIGRGSKWGNPFSHLDYGSAEFKVESREEAVRKYEEWIRNKPDLLACLDELKGKRLGCFCRPKFCHGDVLVKLLYEKENNEKRCHY